MMMMMVNQQQHYQSKISPTTISTGLNSNKSNLLSISDRTWEARTVRETLRWPGSVTANTHTRYTVIRQNWATPPNCSPVTLIENKMGPPRPQLIKPRRSSIALSKR
ncbi:hypothetical protein T4A_1090 [Trichinella pseudospiralis]|uniref:Uncharacterized protein n=1 Tax=Trichinella pseudospiralis TaxID=6337 RepID=A0A0V1ETC4_TRIPS|nr:hypothetical protein T4A_1090 [Trichinella pseudospiralis]